MDEIANFSKGWIVLHAKEIWFVSAQNLKKIVDHKLISHIIIMEV